MEQHGVRPNPESLTSRSVRGFPCSFYVDRICTICSFFLGNTRFLSFAVTFAHFLRGLISTDVTARSQNGWRVVVAPRCPFSLVARFLWLFLWIIKSSGNMTMEADRQCNSIKILNYKNFYLASLLLTLWTMWNRRNRFVYGCTWMCNIQVLILTY